MLLSLPVCHFGRFAGDWAGFVGLPDEMIACSNFKLRLLAFVLEAILRLPNGLPASVQLWSLDF